MMWLTWRQSRTQALVAVAVLTAAAVYLLITGIQLRHSYTADLAACREFGSCSDVLDGLQGQYNGPLDLIGLLLLAAPALIGIFTTEYEGAPAARPCSSLTGFALTFPDKAAVTSSP